MCKLRIGNDVFLYNHNSRQMVATTPYFGHVLNLYELNAHQLHLVGVKSSDWNSSYEPAAFAAGYSTSPPSWGHVRNSAQGIPGSSLWSVRLLWRRSSPARQKWRPQYRFLTGREFFKYLAGRPAFDAPHYFRRRKFRRRRDQKGNMVFTHNSPQDLNFKPLADLAYKFANSQGKDTLKNLTPIFCYQYEVILDLLPCVAATTIVHIHFLKATACWKLARLKQEG